jgi:hypothetical protein
VPRWDTSCAALASTFNSKQERQQVDAECGKHYAWQHLARSSGNTCSLHVLLQVKENETEEERRARLEMEALQADENERREQVRTARWSARFRGAGAD